jgi:hypothetical protein
MLPSERARYLPVLDRLRAELSPTEFTKQWDLGQELGPEEAVALALETAERYAHQGSDRP